MKKQSIGWLATMAALCSLHGNVQAQSTVQVSGIVDAAVRIDMGSVDGSITSLASGLREASRLTFSGVEDLGSGWKAGFVLESGVSLDTGAGSNNPPGVAAGPFTFGRLAALSAGNDAMGYVSLGRQYAPLWAITAGPANDPFGAGWLGGIAGVYSFTVRASNALVYSYGYGVKAMALPAPRNGFGAALMYSPSETSSPAAARSGEQVGANLSYGDGTWWVGYGYHNIRGSNTSISATAPVTDAPTLQQQTLGASYQLPVGRIHVGFNTGKNGLTGTGAVDRFNWHVGGNFYFDSVHNIRVFYGQANDKTAVNADLKTLQLGYGYDLSKRTSLYTAVGQVYNNSNATAAPFLALGTYAKGSNPRSLIAGVRHVF